MDNESILKDLLKRYDSYVIETKEDNVKPIYAPAKGIRKKRLNKKDVANYLNLPLSVIDRWIRKGILTEGHRKPATNYTTWTKTQIDALSATIQLNVAVKRLMESFMHDNKLVTMNDLEYYFSVNKNKIEILLKDGHLPKPDVIIDKTRYWYWETIRNAGVVSQNLTEERKALNSKTTDKPCDLQYMI